MRNKDPKLALIGAAVVVLLCQTSATYAASESCSVGIVPIECWTDPVRANGNSHHVHIDVSPHLTWSVVDKDNGKVVARGTSGWGYTRRTITGLYGRYRLHIQNGVTAVITGGSGTINNN